MASSTTMSTWSEQLARSLMPGNLPPSKLKRGVDQFNRTVKQHNFARTNQFEVEEKFDGLEEKFHILSRADISDALNQRRSELQIHLDRWIPDALDLLLHLSHRPLKFTTVNDDLSRGRDPTAVPATLKWSELDEDDQIDHQSRLWRQPGYSDISSDEEADSDLSVNTSPLGQKPPNSADEIKSLSEMLSNRTPNVQASKLLSDFQEQTYWNNQPGTTITEAQLVRELLFAAQGLPTGLFERVKGRLVPGRTLKISHLTSDSLESALLSVADVDRAVQTLASWSNPHPGVLFMQVLADHVSHVLSDFRNHVSELQSLHLRMLKEGGVISLLQTLETLSTSSDALVSSERFLVEAKNRDAIGHLDILFDYLSRQELLGDLKRSKSLIKAFRDSLICYCQQLEQWVEVGAISASSTDFFIQHVPDQKDKARLWQGWYICTDVGTSRPPQFLQQFASLIFACGKTVAFIKMLGSGAPNSGGDHSIAAIIRAATTSHAPELSSFATSLCSQLEQYFSSQLQLSTAALQSALQDKCNLSSTLTALSVIYLGLSPLATETLDARLFSHLDRSLSTWNDRFLVSDLMSELFSNNRFDTNRVIVYSEPTNPTTLSIARKAIDVLSNIAFDYLFPWPIANILIPENLASYRRIALLLMQIRRARYVLEQRAYLRLRILSSSSLNSPLIRQAQTLHTTLLIFSTTLYTHLTSCVIAPLTMHLHASLTPSSPCTSVGTIDDLIALHQRYLARLEGSCLTTKNLKVLKDTVASLLDLCLDFSFSLSDLVPLQSSDLPSSERAAERIDLLRQKTQKLQTQFKKLLDFLVAGLRGVARSISSAAAAPDMNANANVAASVKAGDGPAAGKLPSTPSYPWDQGEMMELLADRLDSALSTRKP